MNFLKNIFSLKTLGTILLIIVVLVILLYFLIKIPSVQTKLVHYATDILSKELHTKVSVHDVDIDLFTHVRINGILVEDYKQDSMIIVDHLNTNHSLLNWKKIHFGFNNVSLEGVTLNLENTRVDSVLNLTKTFASKSPKKETTTNTKSKQKSNNPLLEFKNLNLENLTIRFIDSFNYRVINLKLDELIAESNKILLTDPIFNLKNLTLNSPNVQLTMMDGDNRPRDLTPQYLAIPFQIHTEQFALNHGKFRLIDLNSKAKHRPDEMSFADLLAENLEVAAHNVTITHGQIDAMVDNLSAEEKSGLKIKHAGGLFSLNSNRTYAKNLVFQSNRSILKGFLRFDYENLKDYILFAKKVKVTGDMQQSNVNLKDLTFIVPMLHKFEQLDIGFNTKASGIMNQLNLYNLQANLNHKGTIQGQVLVQDMFLKGGKLNLKANITQSNFDKQTIALIFNEPIKSKQIENLGKMQYRGKFDGDFSVMNLTGILNSNIGVIKPNNLFLNFTNSDNPIYKGGLSLDNTNLSKFLDLNFNVSNLNANFNLDGQGFNPKLMNTDIKGQIQHIELLDEVYSDIALDGIFSKSIFNGKINSQDKNLGFLANGKVDLLADIPKLNMNLSLNGVNLQKLKITSVPAKFYGNLILDGSGKSIDSFLGSLHGDKLFYIIDSARDTSYLSTLDINKTNTDKGEKLISIKSKELTGKIIGNYQLAKLLPTLQDYFLDQILVDKADIKKEKQDYSKTNFSLNLDIDNIKNYSKLFFNPLKNIGNGTIDLQFDGPKNEMKITSNLKNTILNVFSLPNISFTNVSSSDNINMNLKVDSVFFNNELAITPLNAKAISTPDGLKTTVELLKKEDKKFVDFNALISKSKDDLLFKILPFTSYYGRKIWDINQDNLVQLNLNNKSLIVKDLSATKDKQKVNINTSFTNPDEILVNFDQVRLEELISGFFPILNTFKGELNGQINILDPLKKPTPVANLQLKEITFDSLDFGDLNLKSDLNNDLVNTDLDLSGGIVDLQAKGNYNLHLENVDAKVLIKKFELVTLDKLLNGLINNTHGNIQGNIGLSGKISKLNLKGGIQIDSMRTTISALNTEFHTANQFIPIEENQFQFKNMEIFDKFNNKVLANGYVANKNFNKFDLNINAVTDKVMVMNTTTANNTNFYGTLFVKANALFTGTIGKLITIKANASNLPNSKLNLAFASNHQTEQYGFYDFVQKDSTLNFSPEVQKSQSGIIMDFDIDINRDGRVVVITNPEVEDRIECNGDGKLAFKLNQYGDMDIKGTYIINTGFYLFTYQGVVQRTFYLMPGGKMTFVGDPMDALIDASANFKVRANAQDLVTAYYGNTTSSEVKVAAKNTVKVNIILNLRNRISKPDISYELDIDQNNPTLQSAFESIETITKNNPDELNKQVMGLLVFQRFFPPSVTGFENTGIQGTDFSNTVFDVLTGQVSSFITDWMQSTFKGMNFDLNYRNYSEYNTDVNRNALRQEFKFAVSQRLLNDRLIFNVGGNYDFAATGNANGNNSFFGGDIDIEYLLRPEGNLRLKVYSTIDNDPLNSKLINKTGGGLFYQVEFNKFFKKK